MEGIILAVKGGGCKKNLGEENRHFETAGGEKNRPPGQNIYP